MIKTLALLCCVACHFSEANFITADWFVVSEGEAILGPNGEYPAKNGDGRSLVPDIVKNGNGAKVRVGISIWRQDYAGGDLGGWASIRENNASTGGHFLRFPQSFSYFIWATTLTA